MKLNTHEKTAFCVHHKKVCYFMCMQIWLFHIFCLVLLCLVCLNVTQL